MSAAIDLNHSNVGSRSLSERINELVDAGLVDGQSSPRPYLGASSLGHECERAIQLDYIRANDLPGAPEPCDGFSGQTLRIFAIGHALEALAAGWLRDAGFDILLHRPGGGQIGFSVAGDRFRGHCDGVILEGPEWFKTPAVWEHKALKNKTWQEIVKKGMPAVTPYYAAQVALYQAYLELTDNPALFTVTNKDTAELYHELVPFDARLAQRTSDKAVRILQATDAGELMPKAFKDGDHFVCKGCRWRAFCWS